MAAKHDLCSRKMN